MLPTELTLNDLNGDVLFKILDNLDVIDWVAMSQVSHYMHDVVDEHAARKIKNFFIDHTHDKRFKEIIRNIGRHFSALHFISVNNLNRVGKLKHQLQLINKHCTKLTMLKVETRKSYASMPLSTSFLAKANFRALRYLELCNVKFDKDLDSTCAASFENIEMMRFDGVANFSGRCLMQLKQLTSLKLISCGQLLPHHLYDFFKTRPQLREIEVIRCRHIDEILINKIINNLSRIERISVLFSFTASINPACLSALGELRALSLHNFRPYNVNRYMKLLAENRMLEQWEINGEDVKVFRLDEETIERVEKCSRLVDLSFVKCNFITDDLLARISKALNLQKFQLRDCWGFSKAGLMNLVQSSPNLTFLAIKNCTIPRTATVDIANAVAQKDSLKIDYDIDCGFRPLEDEDWNIDDDDTYEYDWYCDSNSSDGE